MPESARPPARIGGHAHRPTTALSPRVLTPSLPPTLRRSRNSPVWGDGARTVGMEVDHRTRMSTDSTTRNPVSARRRTGHDWIVSVAGLCLQQRRAALRRAGWSAPDAEGPVPERVTNPSAAERSQTARMRSPTSEQSGKATRERRHGEIASTAAAVDAHVKVRHVANS